MMDMWLRVRRSAQGLLADCRGLAATEFALIVPVMLILFFGTDEFSSGIAVNRKVTLMARTLSDLTSQNLSVTDAQLTNFFNASAGIMTPYSATPVRSTITELYVDPATKVARVQWSKGSAPRTAGTTVGIPTALAVGDTYLIYSEVSYAFVPTVGYVLKNSITLSDFTFTRPRQSKCVMHSTTVCTTT
nr:TadE/TadG family type IV pilus assembly protein [Afipia sp. GAS231]